MNGYSIVNIKQDNFSYELIEDEGLVVLPLNQQMSTYELLDIYGTGEIVIDGTLLMLDS